MQTPMAAMPRTMPELVLVLICSAVVIRLRPPPMWVPQPNPPMRVTPLAAHPQRLPATRLIHLVAPPQRLPRMRVTRLAAVPRHPRRLMPMTQHRPHLPLAGLPRPTTPIRSAVSMPAPPTMRPATATPSPTTPIRLGPEAKPCLTRLLPFLLWSAATCRRFLFGLHSFSKLRKCCRGRKKWLPTWEI